MNERRKHPREKSLNLIDCSVLTDDGLRSNEFVARTLNVSRQGVLIDSHLCLVPGQKCRMTICLGERNVDLAGEVVRVDPAPDDRFHIGVEVAANDSEASLILERYLELLKAAGLN